MEIINTWQTDEIVKKFFTVYKPVYVNGDFAIYKQADKVFLYTYKNLSINQLAGLNKSHVDNLANNHRPEDEYQFIYDRAMKIIEKWSSNIDCNI